MKIGNKITSFIFLQLSILAICLLPFFICKIQFEYSIIYFLFQLCSIFIPGFLLFVLLNKEKSNTYAWSYSYGIILLILKYYIFQSFGLSNYSFIFDIVFAIVSIVYLIKKRKNITLYENNSYFVFAIFIVLMIMCFLGISCLYPLPDYNGGTNYNKDFLFWIGNSISFTKGLPVQTFTLVGEKYFYHYFSSIIIAQTSISTSIDVYTLSYYFSYIIPCLLLTYCSFELLSKYIKNKVLLYLGIILILFTEGSTTYLTNHLYFCAFGFDYAYAFGMLSICLLINIDKNKTYKTLFLSCIFLAFTTGFKGPVAIVILMAFGVYALYLIINKQWKNGIIYGLLWLSSFLLVYFVCITNIFSTEERVNGLQFLGIIKAFDNNRWAIGNYNMLIDKFGFSANALTMFFALVLYILRSNFPAILLLIFYFFVLLENIYKGKKIDIVLFSLFVTCIWGILLTINTFQDGNSQMYFIMSTFPYCIFIGLATITNLQLDKKKEIIFAIIILCLSATNIKRFVADRAYVQIEEGISVLNGNPDTTNYRYFFTENDYELAKWIKNNTNDLDYIAVDTFEYDGIRKELGFGVLSERYIWNDGQYANENEKNRRRSIVDKAIDGDINSLNLLKMEGVNYLVQTVSINPAFALDSKCELVFSNGSYNLYRLY